MKASLINRLIRDSGHGKCNNVYNAAEMNVEHRLLNPLGFYIGNLPSILLLRTTGPLD